MTSWPTRIATSGCSSCPLITHPVLNPIELQWGRLKTHVARHNTTYKLSDVERILLKEYDRIEPRDWAGCEKKAIRWEQKWRESDDP
mmetsp:Transcript_13609/g.41043  ORF Transcript_13609/g.41043 Transcript_13609/m.41043 type:complete len:87 (-) Transcript_13609:151-411(-)